jgi:hypothetical protein
MTEGTFLKAEENSFSVSSSQNVFERKKEIGDRRRETDI